MIPTESDTADGAGLAGSTVIVTGASGHIGASYVHAFAAAGANVVATDLQDTLRDGVAVAGRANGVGSGRTIFVPGDVTSDADWAAIVRRSLLEFGQLDVLVNNAAVDRGLATSRALTDITIEDWDRVLAVNVRGTWQGIKAATSALAASGRGRIVNVSSIVGRAGGTGLAHYIASKAAVEGLTRAAARELGCLNISVNAIAPGPLSNDASRFPYLDADVVGAAGRALPGPVAGSDLVGTMLWLASPAAAFVTGQTITVDGGSFAA